MNADELVKTLLDSKQGWSTSGNGWLNGEDGTAIDLSKLTPTLPSVPNFVRPIRYKVNFDVNTLNSISGAVYVDAYSQREAEAVAQNIVEVDSTRVLWNFPDTIEDFMEELQDGVDITTFNVSGCKVC